MSDKKILLITEQNNGNVKKSSLELITAAQKAGEGKPEIGAVLFGPKSKGAAPKLGDYGISKVFVSEEDAFKNYEYEAFVAAISGLVEKESPDFVFALANPMGKDLLPRLSANLGKHYISDCTDIKLGEPVVFTKPIFAGKIIADARITSKKPILASMRPNVFQPASESGDKKIPEIIDLDAATTKGRTRFKELKASGAQTIDLQEASVIVSGGRGMKSAENFRILKKLADVIGAAVGASRAAVDSEYASQDMQVGQTGKTVNPNLYIACGISGAIQHLAGMRTAKYIVAINKDPDAPIFKFADYGIVGDLFKVVPALTEEFRKLLSE